MEIKETIIGIISIILLIFILGLSGYSFDKKSCIESYSEYNPQYTFWSGCRVELNGKITPVDIIREIQ